MADDDPLEALRRLNGRIAGLEAQRPRNPAEARRLTRSARALRRERRRLVLEAVRSGIPPSMVAQAAQVTPQSVASLVRAHG